MRLRILGCDGGIGEGLHTTAFLLDDDVLIDAGTGVAKLPGPALSKINHVFLTHSHVDHTAYLPLLVDATVRRDHPLTIYATEETLEVIKDHIFNWKIWPDFTQIPSADQPVLRYVPIELGKPVEVGSGQIVAVPANHTVPAVGYWLDSGTASLVFSGDTTRCGALWEVVNEIENLRHLIIETAFGDADRSMAELCGHLCPQMLFEELDKLERDPEIFITHIKPGAHRQVMDQISARRSASSPTRLQSGQIIEF
jgi:ribonuclease BN (tRNA processing enzyme)